MRIEPRLRCLEQLRRNPYASDPRLGPLLMQLQAGRSLRDVADGELELLIGWCQHEEGPSAIDLDSMSDDELALVADGDEAVLARYRTAPVRGEGGGRDGFDDDL